MKAQLYKIKYFLSAIFSFKYPIMCCVSIIMLNIMAFISILLIGYWGIQKINGVIFSPMFNFWLNVCLVLDGLVCFAVIFCVWNINKANRFFFAPKVVFSLKTCVSLVEEIMSDYKDIVISFKSPTVWSRYESLLISPVSIKNKIVNKKRL